MAKIKVDRNKPQLIQLPINILRQGSQVIIYTPVLDLCTSGDTKEQAFNNFHDAVHIFIEDLIHQGTLQEVLEELGWECEESKWIPPAWECSQFQSVELPAGAAVN